MICNKMRAGIKHISLAAVSLGALLVAIPVLGQDSPESLLPPGFGDAAPSPSPAPVAAPTPAPGPVSARPATPQPSDPSNRPGADGNVPDLGSVSPSLTLDENGALDLNALDDALQADASFASGFDDLIPGASSSMSSVGRRATPSGWTWHHVPSSAAQGRIGIMQLVPTSQHAPGSIWQRLLHPGGFGGYAEWAVPRGAPR